jgi:hypothetical protein
MASTEAEDIKTVYVDETAGSDESGDGTQAQPYKSAAHAIFAQGPSPPLVIMTANQIQSNMLRLACHLLKRRGKAQMAWRNNARRHLKPRQKPRNKQSSSRNQRLSHSLRTPIYPKQSRSAVLSCGVESRLTSWQSKIKGLKGTAWTASSSVRMGP